MTVLLIIQVLALIGCTPAPSTFETLPTPAATVVLDTVIPTQLPETPTLTVTPFVPKAVIKIVSHSPLSGNQGVFGKDMMRAALNLQFSNCLAR
jgi:hypothetical protein